MTVRTVGIAGGGNMARGIARRLATAGHTVLIFDRKPESAAKVAAEAGDGQPGTVSAEDLDDVLAAEIVVIAMWYPGSVDFARAHATALANKIVIDIANPLDESYTGLSIEPTTSAAEEMAKAIPGSSVVKAFNTQPAPPLFPGVVDHTALDTYVASDDADAKAVVLDLLPGSGLRGVDAGKLSNSRLLERLCAFGIELSNRYHTDGFGFKFLPAGELPEPS
jgi:8-hydroxy-5-deazaflavin:NADPH oxidoreductase